MLGRTSLVTLLPISPTPSRCVVMHTEEIPAVLVCSYCKLSMHDGKRCSLHACQLPIGPNGGTYGCRGSELSDSTESVSTVVGHLCNHEHLSNSELSVELPVTIAQLTYHSACQAVDKTVHASTFKMSTTLPARLQHMMEIS